MGGPFKIQIRNLNTANTNGKDNFCKQRNPLMKPIFALLCFSAFLMWSCNQKPATNTANSTENLIKTEEMPTQKETPQSLTELLTEKKEGFLAKASQEKIDVYEDGVDVVAHSGILEAALKVGDVAPDFALTNALGTEVSLYEALKNGPVVLTWYRGGWCPYCNITLHYFQEMLPDFKAAGAQMMALTPELPDKSLDTKEKHNLEFEVLSDVNNAVAREYGIVFELTPAVAKYYENFGLADYNGNDSNELPLAATYVIDSDRTIQYAFLDADYRNRAEPSEVLAAVKGL